MTREGQDWSRVQKENWKAETGEEGFTFSGVGRKHRQTKACWTQQTGRGCQATTEAEGGRRGAGTAGNLAVPGQREGTGRAGRVIWP